MSPSAIDPKCSEYPCYTLTVVLQGEGSGSWQTIEGAFSLTPDGKIDCRMIQGEITADSDCSHEYVDILRSGTVAFFYRVTPEFGSRACVAGVCKTDGQNFSDGLGPDDKSLLAGFNLQSYSLTVSATGSGSGNWVNDPAGTPCGTGCSTYVYGSTVEIEALPQGGSRFGGWTGACTGQQAQCLIGISGELETAVIFRLESPDPTATPSVKPTSRLDPAPPSSTPTADPEPGAQSLAPSSPAASTAASTFADATPVASALPAVDPATGDGGGAIQVAIVVVAAIILAAIAIGVSIAMRRRRAQGP